MPVKNLSSVRNQYALQEKFLGQRLKQLLPVLMREQGIGLWLVLCREYNEDPVFSTLVPPLAKNASRLCCFAFVCDDARFSAISLCRPNPRFAPYYEQGYNPNEEDQWEAIAKIMAKYGSTGVYVNISDDCPMADGLSALLKEKLVQHLPAGTRLKSAEQLVVRWLETRTEAELALYPEIHRLPVGILRDAYSRKVITPGVTTTTDVEYYIMQRIAEIGMTAWFAPDVDLQRRGESDQRMCGVVIEEGDLLHTDWGLVCCGLHTDTQRLGYVLRQSEGESEIPPGILAGFLRGNRFQDIVRNNFIAGRTGNKIFEKSIAAAEAENLRPMLYSHPIGVHGHAAGPCIGLYDNPGFVPGRGEYKLHDSSCFALELNVTEYVPEWKQDACFFLEETIAFVGGETYFMDDARDKIQLI